MNEREAKMLREMLSGGDNNNHPYFTKPLSQVEREVEGERLKGLMASYNYETPFKEGDLVEFKPNMATLKFPATNRPAIVMELLPEDQWERGSKETSNAQYCEPQNMVIGIIDPDGEFMRFSVNKARFQLAEGL